VSFVPRGHRLRTVEIGTTLATLRKHEGSRKSTAKDLGVSPRTVRRHLAKAKAQTRDLASTIATAPPIGEKWLSVPPMGAEAKWVLKSSKDNKFRFAAFGDLHAGSKYCRWDVRSDLTKRAEEFKAQAIIDTGNWIDGCRPFNIHDLEAIGLHEQCELLARKYPKTKIPTYAIAGSDHEGWYAKSEGVDVGWYCEKIMRQHGHPWTNLGYIEADIVLQNANTKKASIMRVMHPGGGSAYALSYKPQKIVESFEGGEKPAVLLIGHYHKIDFGVIRNVWYVQTGTSQDQTPFLRTRQIQAHVGGFLIECEQDPITGAIVSFTPQARLYYNVEYYFRAGKGNDRWNQAGPIKPAPRSHP
jgi:hypothetical protein